MKRTLELLFILVASLCSSGVFAACYDSQVSDTALNHYLAGRMSVGDYISAGAGTTVVLYSVDGSWTSTAPADGECGSEPVDSDDDGTPDESDNCPADGNKTEPGVCGCGTADTDTDGDSTLDCNDSCPTDADKTAPGECGCGVAEGTCSDPDPEPEVEISSGCEPSAEDFDGDCIENNLDNCPGASVGDVDGNYNPKQLDTDGDKMGDECDASPTTIANVYRRYFAQDGSGDLVLPAGVERLGFSFSQPIITFIPGYFSGSGASVQFKPVVILSGGYDPTKDYIGPAGTAPKGQEGLTGVEGSEPDLSNNRRSDSLGNAVYFLDAMDGTVIAKIVGDTNWADGRAAQESSGSTTKVISDLDHSVAAAVTPVDANGDGVVERLYFPDVIGNIWRVDLFVKVVGSGASAAYSLDVSEWKAYKFAELGTDDPSNSGVVNDRRFFNQIDVARTRVNAQNVDALMVGTGNVANPKRTATENHFYMIKDERVLPTSGYESGEEWAAPAPIQLTDLVKINSSISVDLSQNGWYYELDSGEKVVSSSTTLDGTTYFTTLVPGTTEACAPPTALPQSRLYAVTMKDGSASQVSDFTDSEGNSSRYKNLGNNTIVFQQIDPYVSSGGKVQFILPETADTETDVGGEDAGSGKVLHGAGSFWRTEKQ